MVKLHKAIVVESVSIEHILSVASPDPSSAPKDIAVFVRALICV